ncbi:MAG: 2-C-methyl-D-erythritol 4-phosphate cytidylyltransferase [Candidatus Omnitrophica bacterium]|nr:2-C-methyl-D-erythritol 4-phosphate cytidylyltransferase [Candidatus Omnitrophota bacterium]
MSLSVTAIVPAGGSGSRLGLKTKKPFVMLSGKPLLYYSIKALEASGVINEIIVAAEESQIHRVEALVRRFGFRKVKKVVVGGSTRSGSVKNCLDALTGDPDIVLIHDAARPMVSVRMIRESIRLASKYGACVVAVPESDTIKLGDRLGFVKRTIDRRNVFRAQTPQTFKAVLIKEAYEGLGKGRGATDDSSILEDLGIKIKILPGSYRNIKITTREDLKIAEALL